MLYRDDYVNAIRAVYESTKVETYIPHPSERARSGVWEAATSMGMQVRRPETFFELDCVQKEAMPALTVTLDQLLVTFWPRWAPRENSNLLGAERPRTSCI